MSSGFLFKKPALLVLLLLTFAVSRGPFFFQPMVGEEGIHADLYLESPPGPNYGLMARIGGTAIRAPLDHPAPLYASLTFVGRIARFLGYFPGPGQSPDVVIRVLNSLFQFIFWLVLVLAAPWEKARDWKILLLGLAALLASPLAVGSSIYPQTDNTVGWLACGLLAIAIQGGNNLFWPLAAAFLGFSGKQEWNICVLAALTATGVWGLARGEKKWLKPLAGVLLGTLAGSYLSWLFDPLNWSGGVDVMLRVSTTHNVVSRPSGLGHWFYIMAGLSPFLGALAFGLALQAWIVLKRGWRKADLPSAFGLCLSFGLAAPFLLSTWAREFRYFAPAFAAMSAGLVFQLLRWEGTAVARKRLGWVLGCILLLGVVFLGGSKVLGRSVTEAPMVSLKTLADRQTTEEAKAGNSGCIPVLATAYTYSKDSLDFVDEALSPEDQQALVSKAGKALCP